jgi:GNAT superfamily N-acetyltransferase
MIITEQHVSQLPTYGSISIAFKVREVLDCTVIDGGLGGFRLEERKIQVPYIKDYDQIAGEGPHRWNERFDTSQWTLLIAQESGQWLGGTTLAFDTPGADLLENRDDLLVLWDLRIAPEARRRGIGSALFRAAADWGRLRGCKHMKVETQNINVPACRLYARHGCVLGAMNRFAYPKLPNEVQLLWYKHLG